MKTENYAHPDALVSTDWVAEHTNDPSVRIVETDKAIGANSKQPMDNNSRKTKQKSEVKLWL